MKSPAYTTQKSGYIFHVSDHAGIKGSGISKLLIDIGKEGQPVLKYLIYGMIYSGSLLMLYNIIGFSRYARYVKGLRSWHSHNTLLYVPIILLIGFLLGYLAVGILGKPDLIVASILFGGSIFVFVMYLLLKGITQQIVKSEQIEVRLKAAEESDRMKATFLASISHEMRTPINVILGNADLAMKTPAQSPETKLQLERIDQSARHLLGLINNILDLNHIDKGMLQLKNEVFSLDEELYQVNTIAQSLCDEKGLTYETDFSDTLQGYYQGDAVQIRQILLCLLDNAVKYTEAPGTVSLKAACVGQNENQRTLRFDISDTGTGIDEDFLPVIFDAFTQEDDSPTNRYGGTGLSLTLTRKTLSLMGGSIDVQSQKNVGTVFTILLPLSFVSAKQPDQPADPEVGLEGRRILIVEDMIVNAEIVADLLDMEGILSDRAENGQVAVEMFCANPVGYYDAILMDLRMPVMDGLEAARRIRALSKEDAKTVPIIALTANAFDEDIQQSLNAGMNVHLAKPSDAELLYRTLRQQIQKRQSVKEQ